jgi:hypothetical protein
VGEEGVVVRIGSVSSHLVRQRNVFDGRYEVTDKGSQENAI